MTNLISLVAGITEILSVVLIAACARHCSKEYLGLGKSLTTFAVSLGVVAVYYGILAASFWHMIPARAAGK
jgi:hypothetical protein